MKNDSKDILRDKIAGALFGVAVGDALGGPLEFMDAAAIAEKYGRVEKMIGGGWLSLRPGETTDDTAMTLAVAEGIMEDGDSGRLNPAGYVVDSLKCAIYAIWTGAGFKQAVANAANMGGDADTIAAICDGLAGAVYGYRAIPGDLCPRPKKAHRGRCEEPEKVSYEENTGERGQRPGWPLQGRSRRAPITVHVPTGLLDAVDDYVEERSERGTFSKSDFFCEAAMEYMRKLGLDAGAVEADVRLERTKSVPESGDASGK